MKRFCFRALVFILICAMLAPMLPALPARAALTYEFYDDYNTVATIANYNSCTGMQGMALDDTYLYNIKINSSTEANAMITRTHKDTGDTVRMINAADGTEFFTYLSHANDLGYGNIAGVKTLFVTPSVSGSNSLIRYSISGTKLTKIGNYTAVLNGTEIPLSSAQVMKVDDENVTLICKRGKYIYTGTIGVNQTSGKLVLTQLCTLDVAHVTINGVVKDLTDYLHQGFGYYDNKIYVPITGSVDMSISIIAVFDIDGASGTIRNDPTLSFQIISTTYATKFEIESCGICPSDGKLYFNTNRATASSGNYDGVHYIKGYFLSPPRAILPTRRIIAGK